jgi:hypothetical protein
MLNADCPREQMPISEHEAYYHFASKNSWKKAKIRIVNILMTGKITKSMGSCYGAGKEKSKSSGTVHLFGILAW